MRIPQSDGNNHGREKLSDRLVARPSETWSAPACSSPVTRPWASMTMTASNAVSIISLVRASLCRSAASAARARAVSCCVCAHSWRNRPVVQSKAINIGTHTAAPAMAIFNSTRRTGARYDFDPCDEDGPFESLRFAIAMRRRIARHNGKMPTHMSSLISRLTGGAERGGGKTQLSKVQPPLCGRSESIKTRPSRARN